MIIASTSTIFGSAYLEYLLSEVDDLFQDIEEILFIPFARPSGMDYDSYTDLVEKALTPLGIYVKGIHEYDDPKRALYDAKAIFVGGGNTFLLVKTLYDLDLMDLLGSVVRSGTPYLGTSAGSNICGPSMKTTNDMPIVLPKDFTTTGLIPYNINAHYLDPDPKSQHKGETRETRIKEFHKYNGETVIGLRESSYLRVIGDKIQLKGPLSARVFEKDKEPYEVESDYLFNS